MVKMKRVYCPECGRMLCRVSGKESEVEVKCSKCKGLVGVKIVDDCNLTTKILEDGKKAS